MREDLKTKGSVEEDVFNKNSWRRRARQLTPQLKDSGLDEEHQGSGVTQNYHSKPSSNSIFSINKYHKLGTTELYITFSL